MLAECYTRLGWEEQRIDALRNAGEGPTGSEAARLALARSLAESSNLDEALAILLPLAEGKPELRLEIARLSIQKTRASPPTSATGRWSNSCWLKPEKARPEATKELRPCSTPTCWLPKGQMARGPDTSRTAQSRNPQSLHVPARPRQAFRHEMHRARALRILDQAEKDLGPSLDIRWLGWTTGPSRAAMRPRPRWRNSPRRVSASRPRTSHASSIGLGRPRFAWASQPWPDSTGASYQRLQPDNLRVLMGRFDLALAANDETETGELVENIRKGEGEQGTNWRFVQALDLINRARRGDSTTLEAAQSLASEIASRRADWWAAPLLNAQIAELQNRPEQALTGYMKAVKLGNAQPAVIRRLLGLLYERNQFDEIDQRSQLLRDRGIALPELTARRGHQRAAKGRLET